MAVYYNRNVGKKALRKLNTSNQQDKLHKTGLFRGLKSPKGLTKYTLYRGVTDFGTLEQFNVFQSGRSFLKILQYPEYLKALGNRNPEYQELIDQALHIIEFEFKGLSGLEDIRTDTTAISDGLNEINVIHRVTEQSAATISMEYIEKSGSPLSKFCDLYLNGIFDTRSGFKHYYGLIEDGTMDDGYENEVFTLLYWVTDQTGLTVEQAYLFLACQITGAPKSIYNSTKGNYDPASISIEFNCFPARSPQVNALANEMLQSMNIVINNTDMEYSHTSNYNNNIDR